MSGRGLLPLVMGLGLLLLGGCSSLPKNQIPRSDLSVRAERFLGQGDRHFGQGRPAKACLFYEQALSLHASVDDREGVARALTALGRAHLALGETDRADGDFSQAAASVGAGGRPDLLAQALTGRGEVALARGNPAAARQWFDQGLALALADTSRELAVLRHDLGCALWQLGEAAAAEAAFRQALAMNEGLGNPRGCAANLSWLARVQAGAGDLAAARQSARRALLEDKAADHPVGIAQDLDLLSELAGRDGDEAAAADYRRRAALAWGALGRAGKAAPGGGTP